MNEQEQSNSEHKTKTNFCQQKNGDSPQRMTTDEDEIPFGDPIFNLFIQAERIADALEAQNEALSSIPREISDLTYVVEELAEEIREQNRRRDEGEPPQTTTEGSPPLAPLPIGRGGSTPRTKASPGLQRLRELKKGGSK